MTNFPFTVFPHINVHETLYETKAMVHALKVLPSALFSAFLAFLGRFVFNHILVGGPVLNLEKNLAHFKPKAQRG